MTSWNRWSLPLLMIVASLALGAWWRASQERAFREPFQRVRIARQTRRELARRKARTPDRSGRIQRARRSRRAACVRRRERVRRIERRQRVKHSERHGREHRLGTPERL